MRRRGKDVMKVPESNCLNCGALMSALGTGDRAVEARPEPGDANVAVCINCGAVMMLDEQLRLRGMTEEEMNELTSDRAFMDQVARMVHRVHFVKHMLG